MATLFIDFENGDDNYGGTSFAPLASGTDGRITGSTFSSATANFPDNGTYPTKNFLAYSQYLNNSSYFAVARTTLMSANISGPTGIAGSLWNVLETLETNTHDLRAQSGTYLLTSGATYTVSCYVKANGRNKLVIRFGDTAAKGIRYNISNGTIEASGASATGSITDAGNGWYRLSLTATADNTSPFVYFILAQDSYTGTTSENYTGDTTKGFYISSPQLELNNTVTSYETPPDPQYISIFNGSTYSTYQIMRRLSSTSLDIMAILSGTALSNQAVDRQYYIGGRWKTITNGATAARIVAGDNVRIMASPDPTLVGNATFTSSKADTTLRTISSSTNASPISITSNNHGLSTGNTVVITNHTINTNANGTWTITVTGTNTFTLDNSTGNGAGGATGNIRNMTNCVIRLDSSVTENVASFGNRGNGRTAWVQSSNVTASLDTTDTKEGDVSDNIAIGAGFITGKAAYKATGILNLSGYQQISFWIKQTAGTAIVAGDISLRLCSDTIGDVTVNTINIPGIVATTRWLPITVNLNTNLGNSIQSIALYIDTDRGAQTFLISNIIACKAQSSADSLNLQSLIGKNTSNEKWWATTQSINGTRIIIDSDSQHTPITGASSTTNAPNVRGYSGVSENTSLFKRETIKTTIASSSTTILNSINDSGAAGNLINFLFGFDRTNMSIRTGETFIDGSNGWGYGLHGQRNFYSINNVGFVRYFWGSHNTGNGLKISNAWYINNNQYGHYALNALNLIINSALYSFNVGAALFLNVGSQKCIINDVQFLGNSGQSLFMSGASNCSILNSLADNNILSFIINGFNNLLKNCIATNNHGAGFSLDGSTNANLVLGCFSNNNAHSVSGATYSGTNYIKDCILNETIEITNFAAFSNGRTVFINNDNSKNNYIHYTEGGTIYNSVAVRYSNAGFSWALAPTSTVRDLTYPLDFAIATVVVNANSLVTIKAWMRRSNIALVTGLRIKGGQIAGVTDDITSYMTSPADTWEQVTLSFTPTEAGVVAILAECFGGSTFTAYVDDISITQV